MEPKKTGTWTAGDRHQRKVVVRKEGFIIGSTSRGIVYCIEEKGKEVKGGSGL